VNRIELTMPVHEVTNNADLCDIKGFSYTAAPAVKIGYCIISTPATMQPPAIGQIVKVTVEYGPEEVTEEVSFADERTVTQ